jgi:hypothetical protein
MCLVGYVVLAAVFFGATQGASRRARWLGLVAIAASAPFFYWLGAFSEQFNSGICYSNVMDKVANAVQHTSTPKALSGKIKALPMRGYETSCSEVERVASKLPGQSAP